MDRQPPVRQPPVKEGRRRCERKLQRTRRPSSLTSDCGRIPLSDAAIIGQSKRWKAGAPRTGEMAMRHAARAASSAIRSSCSTASSDLTCRGSQPPPIPRILSVDGYTSQGSPVSLRPKPFDLHRRGFRTIPQRITRTISPRKIAVGKSRASPIALGGQEVLERPY